MVLEHKQPIFNTLKSYDDYLDILCNFIPNSSLTHTKCQELIIKYRYTFWYPINVTIQLYNEWYITQCLEKEVFG